ncbi:MAG: alpha/beta hydrolase [Gammaproteobacteria bacterium]
MLASLLFIVISVLVMLSALLYFMQPRFIYFPAGSLDAYPTDIRLPFEDVSLTTDDGVSLHGWFIPGDGARGTVLFLHGNAGNVSHRLDKISILHELGLSVFIVDYRGYGRSAGRPSEDGTYLDAQAAWTHLVKDRRVEPARILLFGESLGGAVAAWLAGRVRPAGLILESSFTSVDAMGRRYYPYLPVRWLTRIHYPTLDRIGDIPPPVLIIHSMDDEIVPFEMGQALFAAARAPKKFLSIRGGHNDGFLISGETYIDGLREFISGQAGL